MPAPSQQTIIDALVIPGLKWPGATITFSIPKAGAAWPGYGGMNPTEPFGAEYSVLSETQAANFRLAIQQIDRVIAPRFVETDDATNPGAVRVAFTNVGGSTHAHLPDQANVLNDDQFAGDVWLESRFKTESFAPSQQPGDLNHSGFVILMHELGHAMGLKHPHEPPGILPTDYNSTRYSVMSYNQAIDEIVYTFYRTTDPLDSNTGWNRKIEWAHIRTLQVDDILALQSIYGADPDTNSGANRYSWSQSEAFFETIYDAGGVDTLDLAAHTRGSIIDLTPGSYSSIAYFSAAQQAAYWKAQIPEASDAIDRSYNDPYYLPYGYTWKDNLGIAYGTVIENVTGGSGGDTVSGNSAANDISGNDGDDRILGGTGNDTLTGGAGQDFLRGEEGDDSLSGGEAFDDMHGNQGADTLLGGAGNDWVVGGQGADRLEGGDGDDLVYGNMGADSGFGGAGADTLLGGQDNDNLFGGDGNDWMSGDRGDDALTGGGGADIFYSFAGAGLDRITDFNCAEGDRILLDPGTAYTLRQVASDLVIELGDGARIVLVGVTLGALSGDWLIGG